MLVYVYYGGTYIYGNIRYVHVKLLLSLNTHIFPGTKRKCKDCNCLPMKNVTPVNDFPFNIASVDRQLGACNNHVILHLLMRFYHKKPNL